jgi:uncharacterized Zn-finger protein
VRDGDINCPYCGEGIEFEKIGVFTDADDWGADGEYDCPYCEKRFSITSYIQHDVDKIKEA